MVSLVEPQLTCGEPGRTTTYFSPICSHCRAAIKIAFMGAAGMKTYETIATVEDHGQVRLAGLPFAPGTEVEVIVRRRTTADWPRPST